MIAARNAGPFAGLEPNTVAGWTAFLNRTPYSQAAKDGILRVQTADEDFLANAPGAPLTQAQKRDYLTSITYKQYLVEPRRDQRRGVPRRVLARLGQPARRRRPGRLGGGLLDPRTARDSPTASGSAIRRTWSSSASAGPRYMNTRSDSGETRAWPDGNTSLLRLALSKLIPPAFPNVDVGDGPARPDQLSILKTQCLYDKLDHPTNKVRVRLNATVFNVEAVQGAAATRRWTTCSMPSPGTTGRRKQTSTSRAGGSTPST